MRRAKIFLLMALMVMMISTVEAAALKEIDIRDFDGVFVGNAQDDRAKTGVTAIIFPEGAAVGIDISGGGPASRKTPMISPTTNPTPVNAIVLAGGLAYGSSSVRPDASMATAAYSRCIAPVGTLADGDTIYAASIGDVENDVNMVGTLAADVMSEAIRRAVVSSKTNDAEVYCQLLEAAKQLRSLTDEEIYQDVVGA